MKKIWILVCIMAAMEMAASAAQKKEPDIVVYFHAGNEKLDIIGPAESLATKILRDAGISVEWRVGRADYTGEAEVIEAVMEAPGEHYEPGALASAKLGVHSGTRVEVFGNRIRSPRNEAATTNLLAYALVHEITHIIEGVNRHSETGIMKANWDNYDRQLIRSNSLHFADEDLRMIHAWTERPNRSFVAGLR